MSDQQNYVGMHPVLSSILTAVSFLGALLWAVTVKDAQVAFGFGASLVAIISGIFVIRDRNLSIKKTKKQIEFYDRKNKKSINP